MVQHSTPRNVSICQHKMCIDCLLIVELKEFLKNTVQIQVPCQLCDLQLFSPILSFYSVAEGCFYFDSQGFKF